MILFLVLLFVAAWALQRWSGEKALTHLRADIRTESYLVEPGEPFTLVITVENRSRFPVLFLSCSCAVPLEAELDPGERGKLTPYFTRAAYGFRCFLMPRQRLEHRFRLSLPRRGGYTFSEIRLAAGDFLGLRERESFLPASCQVVVLPKKRESRVPRELLGGLSGERSVRRWLFEDPILSAGFREYTGREPLKTVSWTRSLQSGQLMVRQMDHTAEERATVLFSLRDTGAEELEDYLSLCRSLLEELEAKRMPWAFLHNGFLYTGLGLLPAVEAGLGQAHLDRVLEGLARAVPGSTVALSGLVDRVLQRGREDSCYLLVTSHVTPEVRRLAGILNARTGAFVHIVSGEALP